MAIDAKNALATDTARYPVAKPAPAKPKPLQVQDALEPASTDLVEDLLSPESVKGFAWSFAAHAALLLILALSYIPSRLASTEVFDGRLAGSEFGDPASDQLTGGKGMEDALAMPEAPNAPLINELQTNIMALPVAELKLEDSASMRRKETAAINGGGASLKSGHAGNGDGFGVAKFGHGGETINGVNVKVGDPQFTLIWDTRADIDIHVLEPGGSEIYWENRNGGQGGELDVDDIDGYGPENVNYQAKRGPPGTYRWFVHYYRGSRRHSCPHAMESPR